MNRRFENLTQIWLADGHYGDHYKWRAMRANGVPERFITGDASDYEKFLAFARTVPATLRNPLYHWTHLELRRYFGITELLNEEISTTDLGAGQRTTPGTHGASHPRKIQGFGHLYHG